MTVWNQYVIDVLDGKIPVGLPVKLAVTRHVHDLKTGKDRGLYFDEEAAGRAIEFVKLLRHTKGALARSRFNLQPFQAFLIASVFGWKKVVNGKRRFKKVYFEVSRKNGKSETAAALANLCLIADGEAGAEVYTAATKRDQAKITFDIAKSMCTMLRNDSPSAKKMIGIHKYNVHVESTNSKLEPLSADSDKLDGLNPHCAIIDEYHAHKDSDLLEVLETGMGSREQPLLIITTTAGFNINGPCYQFRKVCMDVLKGVKNDDTLFPLIYTLDEDDDWNDKNVWIKSNPNIGNTPYWDYMEEQHLKAANEGATKEVQVKTKNFNIWVPSFSTWIKDADWVATGTDFDVKALKGRDCYGGLDLASTRDLSSLALFFPPVKPGDSFQLVVKTWCPGDNAKTRSREDGVPYLQWAKDGHVTLTDGNVTDYNHIKSDMLDLVEQYNIKSVAYDRWNSSQLVIDLQEEGFNMEQFGQGFATMSAPTKQFEKMILSKEIDHGNNPVLRWAIGNVALKIDAAENIKVDKGKSNDRVDPVVASIMALGEWMDKGREEDSPYNERGILYV